MSRHYHPPRGSPRGGPEPWTLVGPNTQARRKAHRRDSPLWAIPHKLKGFEVDQVPQGLYVPVRAGAICAA